MFRLKLAALLALLFVVIPSSALAQATDDPCVKELTSDRTAALQYDALVGEYLDAKGDPQTQLKKLDGLWKICSSNLRLASLKGKALAEAGDCESALVEYQFVVASAPSWAHPENAADAKERAVKGLKGLTCAREVSFLCETSGTQIGVEGLPPVDCSASYWISTEATVVEASAPGHAKLLVDVPQDGDDVISIGALEASADVGVLSFACEDPKVSFEVDGKTYACGESVLVAPGSINYTMRTGDGRVLDRVAIVKADEEKSVGRQSGPVSAAGGVSNGGELIISCDSPGIRVEILSDNGVRVRTRGCGTTQLGAHTYTIRASASGYQDHEETVTMTQGKVETRNISLMPLDRVGVHIRLLGMIESVPGQDLTGGAALYAGYRPVALAEKLDVGIFVDGRKAKDWGVAGGVFGQYFFRASNFFHGGMGLRLGYGLLGFNGVECPQDAFCDPEQTVFKTDIGDPSFLLGLIGGVDVFFTENVELLAQGGLTLGGGRQFVLDLGVGVAVRF